MTVLFTMGFLIGVSVTFAEGGYFCQDQTGIMCRMDDGSKGELSCIAAAGQGCHGCGNHNNCFQCECRSMQNGIFNWCLSDIHTGSNCWEFQ